jgi:glutaconyl-CoA/methylmalonyl-CoA decarboxylase subunit gamma
MKKFKFTIHGNPYDVEILGFEENTAKIEVNGTLYEVEVNKEIKMSKTPTLVRAATPQPSPKETRIQKNITRTTNATVKAPLPGTIIQVLVKAGDKIAIGQKLLTMEAMKMENNVLAERDGTVTNVKVKPGDNVQQNDVLVEIE